MFHEPALKRIEPLTARGDRTVSSRSVFKRTTREFLRKTDYSASLVSFIFLMQVCFPLLCLSLWGLQNNLHYAAAATASLPNNPRYFERGLKQANSAIPAPAQMKGLGCWELQCSHLILPAPLNGEQR